MQQCLPVPCTIPADVLEALSPGIVHPGQWVMTRRDTQLAWLIRFARAWADLTAERQEQLTGDPWQMKAFAETIHAASAESARLALLHLAHPDTFEPIVSSDHKNLIAGRFADVAGTDPDIDRRLLAARAAARVLDHLLIHGEGHLRQILTEYAQHYDNHRPHQAREQRAPLCEPGKAIDLTTRIKRRQTAQGLINEYARSA
jgi:hypothetical protein